MKEQQLKKQIFYFLIFSKVAVILIIWFHWDTGGFSRGEMASTIAMIIPLFSVYATAMVNEYITNRYIKETNAEDPPTPQPKLTKTFRMITYITFPIYTLLIIYIISLKPQGNIAFSDMATFIAGIESGFGIYIGQIVFALFKKEN